VEAVCFEPSFQRVQNWRGETSLAGDVAASDIGTRPRRRKSRDD
jgi:hypothetical protein